MVIGVLQEAGVDLHLASEDRLHRVRHVVPRRDLVVATGQVGVGRDHAQLLLPGERALSLHVPSLVEPALVPVDPFRWDVVRRMGRARREVHEERPIRHQRLLLADPADGVVGQVLGQVVALLRRGRRLDRRRAAVQRRVPLVVLAADEPVEGLEPPPPDGHASNGPIGDDCHTGTSWHLPNCAVEYPFSFRVIANGALVFGRSEL